MGFNTPKTHKGCESIDQQVRARITGMTLLMNYKYRIDPDALQEQTRLDWLASRKVYN